jgi:hypothetical protein
MVDRRKLEGRGEGAVLIDFIETMTGFRAPDRILEKVMGSSHTHRYWYERENYRYYGELFFARLHSDLPEGVRSYVSPDRRWPFKLRADGLWQFRETQLSDEDERRIWCALNGHRWEPTKRQEIDPVELTAPIDMNGACDAVLTVRLVDAKQCRSCRLTV